MFHVDGVTALAVVFPAAVVGGGAALSITQNVILLATCTIPQLLWVNFKIILGTPLDRHEFSYSIPTPKIASC